MRTFNKVKTNKDVYHPIRVASDAWIKWSQEHPDEVLSFTEWMEKPYDGANHANKEM